MENLLENLTSTMNSIATIHKELLVVIEDEKCAMLSWNMAGVILCAKNKEKIFDRLESLEKQRILHVESIVEKYNLPKSISLSLIIERLPESYKNILMEERVKILSLSSKVKHKNSINANMASKTGAFLARLMKNIANEFKPANTYSRNGLVKKDGYSRVFNKSF